MRVCTLFPNPRYRTWEHAACMHVKEMLKGELKTEASSPACVSVRAHACLACLVAPFV